MSTRSSAGNRYRRPGAAVAVAVALLPLGLAAPHAAVESPPAPARTRDAGAVARAVGGHQIAITVTGALPMTKAKVTLKGVQGKAEGWKRTVKVAKRKTVKRLPSGRYRITAAKMTHHGASAKAVPRKWWVSVTGRQGAAVQVTYARVAGAVERVSTSSRDKQANGRSEDLFAWSPDGTRIAFISHASNLVPGDADESRRPGPWTGDLFVKNLTTGRTTLMSTGNAAVWYDQFFNDSESKLGYPAPFSWVSRTRLAFFSSSRTDKRVSGVVKDVRTNREWTAPLPRGARPQGFWSPDGSAFLYTDHPNRTRHNLFVMRLDTGTSAPVSATENGALGNGASDKAVWSVDGTRVAFHSSATNLTSSDTRGHTNVYVKTVATGALQMVSADANGNPGDFDSAHPVWSPDGTRVAFVTSLTPEDSPESCDLFVKSLTTGSLRRIATDAWSPLWSPNGSKILFVRAASDSFMISDLATGSVTRLLRHSSTDAPGDKHWSPEGTQVLFSSSQALVASDTNGGRDLFVVRVGSGRVKRVSTTSDGAQALAGTDDPEVDEEGGSRSGVWSPDGTRILFRYGSTPSANLVPNDTNGYPDLFVKTLK